MVGLPRLTRDEAASTVRRWQAIAESMPANAQPHPGKLDETGAMVDVRSPEMTYVPDLTPEIIEIFVLIGLFGWYGAIGIAKSVVWIMENLNPFHDDH